MLLLIMMDLVSQYPGRYVVYVHMWYVHVYVWKNMSNFTGTGQHQSATDHFLHAYVIDSLYCSYIHVHTYTIYVRRYVIAGIAMYVNVRPTWKTTKSEYEKINNNATITIYIHSQLGALVNLCKTIVVDFICQPVKRNLPT